MVNVNEKIDTMDIDETEIINFSIDFSRRINPNSQVDTLLKFRHDDRHFSRLHFRISC